MGLRDMGVSKLVAWIFSWALAGKAAPDVWNECEFLWIDGSLFYRRISWDRTGPTWKEYLDKLQDDLVALLNKCPKLRVVVFQIDKYGPRTIEPLPKKPTQAHRYKGCKHIENCDAVFQPGESVAGITSTDTFGNLDSRLAFNAMVTVRLRHVFQQYQLEHGDTMKLMILDGAVIQGLPSIVRVGSSEEVPEAEQEQWCPHAEGDIGLAHWLPRFAYLHSVIHSCDIDLMQVVLQVMRRFAEGGMDAQALPSIHLHKSAGNVVHTFNIKNCYKRLWSLLAGHYPTGQFDNPVDVFFMLIAATGNDFCAPWLCSPKCELGEGSNDGIRVEAIWVAFLTYHASIGPLFEPTTEADESIEPWSVYKLKTWVHPVRPIVASWAKLMRLAYELQHARTNLRVARPPFLLDNAEYIHSQVRRMAWSTSYYLNAAVLGDRMPRGIETASDGKSLFGFMQREDGSICITHKVPTHQASACGLLPCDAPTRPPTPEPADPDPVGTFERLDAAIEMEQ